MGMMVSPGERTAVWIDTSPFYALRSMSDRRPEHLQMKLKVTNHLGKILRFRGIALNFAIDGNVIPTDATLNDLENVMVLPDKSWEGTIYGPSLAEIFTDDKSSGMVLVGIYDVVTETDEANNPTKRSNIEWIFSYERSFKTEQASKQHMKAYVTAEQAETLAGVHRFTDLQGMLQP